jgi:hypothetical protein
MFTTANLAVNDGLTIDASLLVLGVAAWAASAAGG